jgi:DNA repair exonuclease SbcCD nuclease subunit
MKFIHCADVHLDTPLVGLAQYPGAPVSEIRNATRRAFEKILSAAIVEKVDFIVIAGDLYDTGLKSFESVLFFNKQMVQLHDAGIEVYLIYGNHDAASKLTKQLDPPKNVHVLHANQPETIVNDNLGIAIHGQSFATPEVTEDLAVNYPAPVHNLFNIGVLHTSLSGYSEHANYAPCSLEELKNKGYEYWALGHVHNRQILCTDPYIVFPGNIQGRHGKEQGEKSSELVTVSETGTISVREIATSVIPWLEITISASGCHTADDVYDKMRAELQKQFPADNERVSAIRIKIAGASDAHAELSRDPEQVRNQAISIASECGNNLLWVERVQVATVPHLKREGLLERDDPLGEIARTVAGLRQQPSAMTEFEGISQLAKKLPSEVIQGADPISLDATALQGALEEAEELLFARLSGIEAGTK